jgi:hypothetical protein
MNVSLHKTPRPIKVINVSTGEVLVFRSVSACMAHYSIQSKQIYQWLNRDGPVLAGPREDLIFEYASEEDLMRYGGIKWNQL